MTQARDTINQALTLADKTLTNAMQLVEAVSKILNLDPPNLDDEMCALIEQDITKTMRAVNFIAEVGTRLDVLSAQAWLEEAEKEKSMIQQQAESTYETRGHENAQKQITYILDQLDEVRLTLFDLKRHRLFHSHKEYEAATTHAETHLLELINAVENVRNVENRLNEWV